MGKEIPQNLLREINEMKTSLIQQDSFNNFGPRTENKPPKPPSFYRQHVNNIHLNQNPTHNNNNNLIAVTKQQIPNKFSPQYAAFIGVKPRAQASARIGLGGSF